MARFLDVGTVVISGSLTPSSSTRSRLVRCGVVVVVAGRSVEVVSLLVALLPFESPPHPPKTSGPSMRTTRRGRTPIEDNSPLSLS